MRFLPPATLAGFLVAVLAVALIAFFTYRAMQSREQAAARVTQTHQGSIDVQSGSDGRTVFSVRMARRIVDLIKL